jgi:predicted nucleic-acid-binding protein
MKYIDTNILVRIITGDNPEQANKAMNDIQSGGQNEFCILDAILVETCFVLEFHDYKMKRADITDALIALISAPQIFVSEVTKQSLSIYGEYAELDYADCLLIAAGGQTGVLTFDDDLLKALNSYPHLK